MSSKADSLVADAQKLETKWSLFGKEGNWQEAADTYIKAANLYKSSEDYDKAADAYHRAYLLYDKLKSPSEANRALASEASCLSQGKNPDSAIEPMKRVVENYQMNGNFSQAAKAQHEIAKVYENQEKYEEAVTAYELAAHFYETDNRPSSALPFRQAAARLTALAGKYLEASQKFEKMGMNQIQQGALRFGAKEHFVNSVICMILNDDDIGAGKATDRYKSIDPSMSSEREYKFLAAFIEAYKQNDLDEMKKLIAGFAAAKQVDDFRRKLFDRITGKLENDNNNALL